MGQQSNDAGERVIKRGEQGETAYVNQFWTVRNRSVGTKHVFVGETRVSSKVIPGDDHVNPGNDKWAGVLGQWWLHRSAQGWANGKNTVKNPHYAGNAMPDNLPEDNFVFFYHPDHLGSTEYVTDYTGELYEHVQYFAFGETWVSEHKNTETLPYLFTSKELDEETGLYYFGARYYDPRTSVWQSADPMLAAQLGRGFVAPHSLSVFAYARSSPLRFVDPDGLYEDEAAARVIEGDFSYSKDPQLSGMAAKQAFSQPARKSGRSTLSLGRAEMTADPVLETQKAHQLGALGQLTGGDPGRREADQRRLLLTEAGVQAAEEAVYVAAAAVPGAGLLRGVSRARPALRAYEVGTADALAARSAVGDAIDIHHVGQAHAMERLIPGYSRATGPAIALPAAEHRLVPRLRGPVTMSARSLLARDIWNLKRYTNVPNKALREVIRLNKQAYPGAFAR